jgi:threonine synthase
MSSRAYFECINGCSRHELSEVIYTCKTCGDLLQVMHESEFLKKKTASEWMKLFDDRYRSSEWPYGSGVWGKKEWVLPEINNKNIVSMYEGSTNLFNAEQFGEQINLPDLWIKLCGNSHTGSFKDLGMTVLVSQVKQMISDGKKIRAVACASTGDTSAALASYAAYAKIPAIIFLPKNKVSTAQLIQPVANNALVLSLDTDFDGCMEVVKKVCSDEGIYLANSMNSLRIEGQKTISIEIVQQLDWTCPDWIFIPGGNLGNVSALGKGFKQMRELGLIDSLPRICVAQAAKANPLYQSFLKKFKIFNPVAAKKTQASAIQIGNPVSVKKAIRILEEFNGVVIDASEDELANAAAQADKIGLFSDPHTGVALAGLIKLQKEEYLKKTDKVVVISTAHGLKFADFKVNYHQNQLHEVKSRHSNLPIDVGAGIEDVRKVLLEKLDTDNN